MPYKIPIFLDRLSTIYSWSKFIKNQDFKMLHLINVKKFKIEIGIEGIFVTTSKWLASFGINKPKRNVMSCDWDSHIFECWGNSRFAETVIISSVGLILVYINTLTEQIILFHSFLQILFKRIAKMNTLIVYCEL